MPPPIANDLTVTTPTNTPVTVTFSATGFSDLSARIVSNPSNGQVGVIDQVAGTVVYTPSENYVGTDSFRYVVNDGLQDSSPATATVNVGNITEPTPPPIANDLTVTTPTNTPVTVTFSATGFSDLSARIVSNPSNGQVGVIDQGAGTVVYTPSENYVGTDSFRYVVNDGLQDSSPATATVNVGNITDTDVSSEIPVAIITGPDTVKAGEVFSLDGSGSYDPDGR